MAVALAPTDHEQWTLDDVGNWTAREYSDPAVPLTDTFAPNVLNQYTSMTPDGGSAEAFGHDWLGQLRTDENRQQQYVWDLFGRLTRVLNGVGSEIARYRYDVFNRRVERYVEVPSNVGGIADQTTWFVYDGWRAIEERAVGTSGEAVRARYGFGLGLDEVLWMDRNLMEVSGEPDPTGVPDDSDGIETRLFLHHDRKGDVVAISDDQPDPEAVSLVERFTYTEYGQVTAWWDPDWNGGYTGSAGLSKYGLPYLYTGQRFDVESGLHYFKNRLYDPQRGRFLRRDLIGYGDGPSLYQYARSNPAAGADPLGLLTETNRFITKPRNRQEAETMVFARFDQARSNRQRHIRQTSGGRYRPEGIGWGVKGPGVVGNAWEGDSETAEAAKCPPGSDDWCVDVKPKPKPPKPPAPPVIPYNPSPFGPTNDSSEWERGFHDWLSVGIRFDPNYTQGWRHPTQRSWALAVRSANAKFTRAGSRVRLHFEHGEPDSGPVFIVMPGVSKDPDSDADRVVGEAPVGGPALLYPEIMRSDNLDTAFDEAAAALANVLAHEAGHMFGVKYGSLGFPGEPTHALHHTSVMYPFGGHDTRDLDFDPIAAQQLP